MVPLRKQQIQKHYTVTQNLTIIIIKAFFTHLKPISRTNTKLMSIISSYIHQRFGILKARNNYIIPNLI